MEGDEELHLVKVDQSIHHASPYSSKTLYRTAESDKIYVLVPLCNAVIPKTGLLCTRKLNGRDYCGTHNNLARQRINKLHQ